VLAVSMSITSASIGSSSNREYDDAGSREAGFAASLEASGRGFTGAGAGSGSGSGSGGGTSSPSPVARLYQ